MENSLAALVQALPVELYIEIYELIFVTPSSKDRFIDANYKSPSCTQVNRATRQRLATSYFGNGTIFYVSKDLAMRFGRSLSGEHRRSIREIRIDDAVFEFVRAPDRPEMLGGVRLAECGLGRVYEEFCVPKLVQVMGSAVINVQFRKLTGGIVWLTVTAGNLHWFRRWWRLT